ncbi:MAG: Nif3-like dinuclear metal center hexameric protein [Scytonema sp. PMC 1069.18]|nr:Nif3-like dinuclear metal center hexameric protein [Scytonema sp. PMC 1069.18]MEC4887912.1 Nif3-like dinuclear metal center hexameric protein [Scytonema sp. PMC 1070.18]
MTTESNLILLEEIAQFLDRFFTVHRYPQEEKGGVYTPSVRPVRRLGVVLEPWTQLQEWVSTENLDALFIHRPWKLEPGQLAPDIGVISYHLAFDERLTLSFNPRLADVLEMSDLEVLGEKDNRPIGMIGNISVLHFSWFCNCINEIFGGYEEVRNEGSEAVTRIAVVGAMTDFLVREASVGGADVYVTGQLRKPAEQALVETKMKAIAIGHRRSEVWGLGVLAGILRERWFGLEVILFND